MGMNNRLLRPRASGYVAPDADARAYLTAVRSADGSALEVVVQRAINDFVVGCKADGIWSAIKASCVLMGARTLSGALTPLVGSAPTNVNFVSGDYDRKTGLLGNGSNKRLDSSRNNNADPQNSQHTAVYASAGGAPAMGIGGGNFGTTEMQEPVGLAGTMRFLSRSSGGIDRAFSGSLTGLVGISRSSSTNFVTRLQGTNATASVSSQAPFNGNIVVFARSAASSHSSARLSFYSIGESLDLALLDSRVSALYTAIGAAIP